MNKHFLNFIAGSILLIASCLLVPAQTSAAEIIFQPQNLTVPQPQSFTVTLTLNTEGENLNAVDGTVLVSKELGEDITVTDSGSVITYWVNRPQYDPTTRTVKFSGTIPGGFTGTTGILFSLVIGPYAGDKLSNAVSVTNLHAYLNDGLGTQAKISSRNVVLGEGSSPVDSALTEQLYIDEATRPDDIPPEVFSPQVSRDDRVYNGQWFINFSTTDKQSGIDHYEIQETRTGRLDAGKWKVASSPYVLNDQELHSYIYIIAVDRQGNERVIKVFPRKPLSWWNLNRAPVGILSGIIILGVVSFLVIKKRKLQSLVDHA